MVWKADAPQLYESSKIRWDTVPYTRGAGLDIGCGPEKLWPHSIGVDNRVDTHLFGIQMNPDLTIPDASSMPLFATGSFDYVYSSHTLEHIKDHEKALREWWRIIKDGGYLILYLPHKKFYPNIGQPGANPDHKHDFMPEDIIEAMKGVGGWDLVENEDRDQDNEYSFFQVYKKYSDRKMHRFSCNEPKPVKTCCVVRYGAFGDALQASSIFPQLKAQGYHITVYSVERAFEVIKHDPHIDKVVLQDHEQVPNAWLGPFWAHLRKKFDRFINLSESVEATLLVMPDRIGASWSHQARHLFTNRNYVEFTHQIADLPYEKGHIRFYATEAERKKAADEYKRLEAAPLIMWVLAGSSVHKIWPHIDGVLARLLLLFPNAKIVTVGDERCRDLIEKQWANEPRIVKRSGNMPIRETLALAQLCDLVVGPETGVMNAVCNEPMPKVVLLSHSSHENLTRDWVNTYPMHSKVTDCYPCHKMIYNWDSCVRDEKTGTSHCMANLDPNDVWDTLLKALGVTITREEVPSEQKEAQSA